MFKHILTFALAAALLPMQAAHAHVTGSNGGSSGPRPGGAAAGPATGAAGGSATAPVTPGQLRPFPRSAKVAPPFVRGVYQPVNMPIPVIMKGKDSKTRLKQMTTAVGHMMASIDPDLKSPSGTAPSLYERADGLRDKLSAPDDVLRALETRARLEDEAGEKRPTEAEIEQASETLSAAANDLQDDVPADVAAAVLRNPQRTLLTWILTLAAAGGVVAGYFLRRSRQPAAV